MKCSKEKGETAGSEKREEKERSARKTMRR